MSDTTHGLPIRVPHPRREDDASDAEAILEAIHDVARIARRRGWHTLLETSGMGRAGVIKLELWSVSRDDAGEER